MKYDFSNPLVVKCDVLQNLIEGYRVYHTLLKGYLPGEHPSPDFLFEVGCRYHSKPRRGALMFLDVLAKFDYCFVARDRIDIDWLKRYGFYYKLKKVEVGNTNQNGVVILSEYLLNGSSLEAQIKIVDGENTEIFKNLNELSRFLESSYLQNRK